MANVYKISSIKPVKAADGSSRTVVAWAASEGAAKQARRAMAEHTGLRPLKDIDIEAIDIPTTKAGLIEWLNQHHMAE